MELSIIIPSLRPHRFANFKKSVEENTDSYELLYNDKPGVLYEIINREFYKAAGKYVVLACDDCVVHKDWAKNMISFMEQQPPLTVGGFDIVSNNRGSLKNISAIIYYGQACSIFPFVRREEVLSNFGYFLDSGLKRFYGDIDLSLRFISIGGQVKTCPDAEITMFSNRDSIKKEALATYSDEDKSYFNNKWDGYDFNLRCNEKEAMAFS
jgi:hypothetical protein